MNDKHDAYEKNKEDRREVIQVDSYLELEQILGAEIDGTVNKDQFAVYAKGKKIVNSDKGEALHDLATLLGYKVVLNG